MEDLASSIQAWGPEPKLTHCNLQEVPLSKSLMTALCTCTNLKHLDLQGSNRESDNISILMASPPTKLRELKLFDCSLDASNVAHMIEAIRQNRLAHLEALIIHCNPIGEVMVGSLLEALISTRPQSDLTLDLYCTGVGEDENLMCTVLSEQFVTEWKAKLKGTKINVIDW